MTLRSMKNLIEGCTSYEALAQLCCLWADDWDVELSTGSYRELARRYDGTEAGEVLSLLSGRVAELLSQEG